MRRALAILAAVALIALGFLVRDLRGDDPSTPTPAVGGDGGAAAPAASVLCDSALTELCDALAADGLDVRREPAAATVDRLSTLADPGPVGGTTAPDAWVTVAPWPAIVDEARTRGGLTPVFEPQPEGAAVASSPLVLVGWVDRNEVLRASCGSERIDWDCVAAAAGSRWADLGGSEAWGPFKPGFDDPRISSLGLATLGNASAQHFGTNGFGTRGLSSPEFLDWLGRLVEAVPSFSPSAGSPLTAMLLTGPASFDVTATTEAAARTAIATSAQRGGQLEVAYAPVPEDATGPVALDAVVARRPGVDAARVADALARAAASAGWHTSEASPEPLTTGGLDPSGLPSATPGGSLPSAGALTALRASFTETYRR